MVVEFLAYDEKVLLGSFTLDSPLELLMILDYVPLVKAKDVVYEIQEKTLAVDLDQPVMKIHAKPIKR